MSKVIRLTENDLVRLVNRVIEEQIDNDKEQTERRFFRQLGGIIKPTIGTYIEFFNFARKYSEEKNRKRTVVFKQFIPSESWIDNRRLRITNGSIGPIYIEIVFETDMYLPNSKNPIPCFTKVGLYADNSTPGVINWGKPENWVSLEGYNSLSDLRMDKDHLFEAFATSGANHNLKAVNLKIDSDAVMNLLKQYANQLRRQKFK